MLKVSALIKYLNQNEDSELPASLELNTFRHFLSQLPDPNTIIGTEMLEGFFRQCLDFTHWQQNRASLTQAIQEIFQADEHNPDLIDHLLEIRWPENMQLIEFENDRDWTDSLQRYLNTFYRQNEKYKLIVEKRRTLALILNSNRSLTVQQFSRKAIINHGHLEPLRTDLSLHFNSDLELAEDQVQKMEIAPHTTAQFRIRNQKISGFLVRGYTFQKFFEFEDTEIEKFPKLFYTLKRIEQYFLNRNSDPFYQTTLKSLESLAIRLKKKDEKAFAEASDTLIRGQNALEHVFQGDKLLSLLLKDLQHTLADLNFRTVEMTDRQAEAARTKSWNHPNQTKMQKPFDLTSLSPTAESPAVELLID